MTDLPARITELGAKLRITVTEVQADASTVQVHGVRADGYRFGYRDHLGGVILKLAPGTLVDIVLDDR